MKRSKSYSKQANGRGKKVKMSSKQQNTQLRPFVFENLPDGVRNQIYELIASNEVTSLSKTGDKLTSSSRLMLSNHQISREFATMLDGSPEINMAVVDFDFASVINFLNSRPATSLAHIAHAVLKTKLIVYNGPDDWETQDPRLVRWAALVRQMWLNGFDFFAEYSGDGDSLESVVEWIEALNTCRRLQRSKTAKGHLVDMQRALHELDCE